MSELMIWHDEADRLATWGTLDPPDACMCTYCVIGKEGGDAAMFRRLADRIEAGE